ncbi:MAG: nitroreductase family protein [Halanaerobium sp.]|nr:nitroreductase family protein [Halanaerobium sp.]
MNQVIDTLLNRKSIRSYQPDIPSDEKIRTIVRAGQQAPFAAQLYSVLLKKKDNASKLPFAAPLLFTICLDLHKLELIMDERGWTTATNDLSFIFFAIQDAALMAENMVIAAESLGLGSCFLGATPYKASKIAREYSLPARVFPLVQLVMGYPSEVHPPRPRYPLEYVLFEDTYPELDQAKIRRAMQVMDEGYLAQDYYRNLQAMIPLQGGKEETFDYSNYSWTEHISRKWGQWLQDPEQLQTQLEACGINITAFQDKKT